MTSADLNLISSEASTTNYFRGIELKFRKTISATVTSVAAVALSLGLGSQAYAGETARACNKIIPGSGACAGEVVFDDTDWRWGERVNLYDNVVDGRGVQVYLIWYDGNGVQQNKRWTCTNGKGNSCAYYAKIAEGTRVSIQACLTDEGREVTRSCGPLSYGRA
ncbi:hypothetical protein ACWD0A_26525 [Streptomyces sp. NPDC002867]